MESNESSFNPSSSSVVQITQSNFDSVLASNEVVFIFTYFEGFKYCTRIMPKFEQAAKELTDAGIVPGKAVMAKLDYRKADTITAKFQFHFYPDLKLFRNGLPSRHYYRGERTVEGFVEFVKKQLSDPIVPFSHLNELHDLSEDEGHIIAYLDSRDQPEYDVLRKVASNLREDYRFYVKFGDSAAQTNRTGQKQLSVVFRSTTGIPVELDETYLGPLLSVSDIISWVKQKCFPFLREITSENEDILRNVGSPVVILIHMPSDTESVKKYKEAISIKEWKSENHQTNFLIADGTRLETLLVHFDKSISDLPIIAISYYSTVNLYDFNVTEKPGKLKEIVYEAYSSEFFHQGIDFYRLCVIIDYAEEEYHICGLFE